MNELPVKGKSSNLQKLRELLTNKINSITTNNGYSLLSQSACSHVLSAVDKFSQIELEKMHALVANAS